MNVLLTGGAGFIGSNIAEEYAKLGHKVTILDNLSSGRLENIGENIQFIKCDLSSDDIESKIKGQKFEVINHHAASIDLRKSISDPYHDARINILGSINILEFARKNNIKKIIYASSGGSVYGEQIYFPADENHLLNPLSPYAISKLTTEYYIHYYKKYFGIDFVILRYSNVFGEKQGLTGEAGVISIFIKKILNGASPVIFGDGNNTRDFIYVKDVVSANVKSLNFSKCGTFNISSGIEIKVIDVCKKIIKLSGLNIEIRYSDAIKGEQQRSVLSNKAAKDILGWEPVYSLEAGLGNTLEWFRKNKK